MPLILKLAIQGKMKSYERAFREAYASAATTTMRRKTTQLERRHKSYIARRLGASLSKATQGRTYPQTGKALQPASEITYGRAVRKTEGGPLNIVGLFQSGATVVPRHARFLWVPTEEGRRLGGGPRNRPRELSPSTFRGGRLLYLPNKGRSRNARVPGRLVLRNNPNITVFVAIRRQRIRPRLQRLQSITNAVMKNYVDLRNRALDREFAKAIKRIPKNG